VINGPGTSVIETNIRRLFPNAIRNGNGRWSDRCPAHDDQRASLSIGIENGRPQLHCHAGCSNNDIARAHDHAFSSDALLYSALDGCSNGRQDRSERKITARRAERKRAKKVKTIPESELLTHPVAEFIFRSKHGKRLYKEVRYEVDGQKTIRMFTYADGAWVPRLRKDVPRVP
jgi:hypothetical protein